MTTEVLIISGTFAPPFGMKLYPYSGLVGFFEEAGYKVHMESIRLFGIGQVEKSIEHIRRKYFAESDSDYILVGHSQGGILALSLASEHPQRVRSVEIFASPVYGTMLASLGMLSPALRAMNFRSLWLRGMRKHEDFDSTKVHSYFSALDAMVVPWIASMVKDGHNYLLVPWPMEPAALMLGQAMVGDRIYEVEILHGTGGHLAIVNHPAIFKSLSARYEPKVLKN